MMLSPIQGERLMPELMTEMVGAEPYHYCPLGDYVVRAFGVWEAPDLQIYTH